MLFENEDIIAIDKPYGFDSHTNESKAQQADFVVPGLIELFEKQRGKALHIVHRLDRTTTGVIVFAKSLEAAKKYQGYFRARETKKTYTLLTAAQTRVETMSCSKKIVRKGDELEAQTDFKLVERGQGFERWEAHPKTGRYHQIRIHAAELGVPILGDAKYGGAPFSFLCLHNRRLGFPDGITIEAQVPRYFDDLSLLNDLKLSQALLEVDRRKRLFSKASTLRLVHPQKKAVGRVASLDRFDSRLVLSWYSDVWTASEQETYSHLADILEIPMLVRFMSKAKPAKPDLFLGGEFGERTWVTDDGSVRHELSAETATLGLYLDQELQRDWVYKNAEGKSVLSLFAYTCGFSVAAAKGGASSVVSVDSNKNMLNWGRRNFEINGLDASRSQFLCRDVLDYLEQAKSKNLKYDLVVCDPPAFSRGEKKNFKLEVELGGLLKSCLEALNPAGLLLFSTNSETLFVDDVRRAIESAGASAGVALEISSIQPSLDFESPGESPGLKSFLIKACTLF